MNIRRLFITALMKLVTMKSYKNSNIGEVNAEENKYAFLGNLNYGMQLYDVFMTEARQLFRLKVLSKQKDFLSLRSDMALPSSNRHTEKRSTCFILTQREPEKFLAARPVVEGGGCSTVVSARISADFCHIPPSGFSQDLR